MTKPTGTLFDGDAIAGRADTSYCRPFLFILGIEAGRSNNLKVLERNGQALASMGISHVIDRRCVVVATATGSCIQPGSVNGLSIAHLPES